MKAIEDIELAYSQVVKRFLPDHVDKAGEIGYQIELFLADHEGEYGKINNLRLKQDGEILSETLYDAVKFESKAKNQEDDLYIPIGDETINLFFGFDY